MTDIYRTVICDTYNSATILMSSLPITDLQTHRSTYILYMSRSNCEKASLTFQGNKWARTAGSQIQKGDLQHAGQTCMRWVAWGGLLSLRAWNWNWNWNWNWTLLASLVINHNEIGVKLIQESLLENILPSLVQSSYDRNDEEKGAQVASVPIRALPGNSRAGAGPGL